jgi:hypothetical protein
MWAEEMERSVREYDPEKEIVVALWLTNHGDVYTLSPEPETTSTNSLREAPRILERK